MSSLAPWVGAGAGRGGGDAGGAVMPHGTREGEEGQAQNRAKRSEITRPVRVVNNCRREIARPVWVADERRYEIEWPVWVADERRCEIVRAA